MSLVFAIGLAAQALACTICIMPRGFDLMHPMSIEVAIATGAARREGLLPADLKFGGDRESQFWRWHRIEEFARKIAAARPPGDVNSLRLICVDSSLITYFRLDGVKAEEIPPAARAPDLKTDLTLVTSEAALQALLAGTLPFDSAVRKNLMHTEDRDGAMVAYTKDPFVAAGDASDGSSRTLRIALAFVLIGLTLPIVLTVTSKLRRAN